MIRSLPTHLALALGLTAAAGVDAAPRLEARGGAGPHRVVVVADEGERTVVDRSTAERTALPHGVEVRALARLGGGWLVAGTREGASGRELYLASAAGGALRELPAPAGRSGRLRHGPALAADDAGLAGAAWLEGDTMGRFAVRWADWDGQGFATPATVSPVPPSGTQLALAAARLADGRRLLVWAGYDGEDDEIWAAIGTDAGWSRPFRVAPDNRVPDVTPAVVATAGGALVAWSRFDGDEYRVAMARLAGDRFVDVRDAGPPGTVFPSFERLGSGLALLARDARRSGWRLASLTPDGRVERWAHLEAAPRERPLVDADESGVVWELGDRSAVSPWD